jgi:hypothetical protein
MGLYERAREMDDTSGWGGWPCGGGLCIDIVSSLKRQETTADKKRLDVVRNAP